MPRENHQQKDHHHWDELPGAVQGKTEEVLQFLGSSKNVRRLCRFAFNDGPHHRRTSSGVIAGLAMYLANLTGEQDPYEYSGPSAGVDFHVPPHLQGRHNRDLTSFQIPTRLLREVFGNKELDDIIESLVDGPPHDGAANVILIGLFEAVFESLTGGTDKTSMRV